MDLLSGITTIWVAGPRRKRLPGAPANQPPVAQPDTATVPANTPTLINVLANDSDPEGGALTLVSTTTTTGTAVVQGGQVLYTPPAGFVGSATVTYVVADPQGATAAGTVAVTVTEQSLAITSNADGTVTGNGEGVITVECLGTFYSGTYTVDTALLADGPVNLVPPFIERVSDADSSGTNTVGDVVGIDASEDGSSYLGLWVYDPSLGMPTRSVQIQADGQGNGAFDDIPGATSNTYTLTSSEANSGVRLAETLAQGARSRTSVSIVLSIVGNSAANFVKSAEVLSSSANLVTHTSVAFTPDGGANSRLVLAVQMSLNNTGGDASRTTVTWNGAQMTRRFVRQSGTASGDCGVAIFDIGDPGTSPGSFVISLFASDGVTPNRVASISACAVELSGVSTTTPVGATGGSTTAATHEIAATGVGSVIITSVSARLGASTGPYEPQAGFTEVQDITTGTANFASLRAFTGYGQASSPGVVPSGGILVADGTSQCPSLSVEYLAA